MNGRVNRHSCLYYARENAQVNEETRLRYGKVTVWAMIRWERLPAMRILHETVVGERYRDILDEIMMPMMQSAEHEHCLFQQYGAPPHYAVATREKLDRDLQDR